MILVVLASGMGKRLNKKIPKCLVKIEDKTILERIIESSKNFKKIIVVGGYKSNLSKKIIKKFNKKNIILINNKDYKSTNMVESFFKSFKKIDQDVLITYSDIVYDSSLLEKMCNFKKDHLMLNSDWLKNWSLRMPLKKILLDAETIKTKENHITTIGQKIKKKLPRYQFMGLIRFNYKNLKKIKNYYIKVKNKKIDFTSFLNLLIQNKILKIEFQKTKKYWFEIDTKKDLSVASNFFKVEK